ncbi:MAG: patatin-like phospholipase family protein [Bdellovibrionales bacterium]|nr:patatin-like phospholipase family protein [Bdellovibrionales bacterium]
MEKLSFNPFNKKIGLALGGGAAKGLAHIGVLRAFDDKNINISYISGTSVGAIVASYYAFGKNLDEIDQLGERLKAKSVFKLNLDKRGFVSTDSIKQMLLNDIGDVNIEDAKIPLAICTTDITSGESVIFKKGKLIPAVCASVAVPGVFTPVEHEGRLLVDGGITQNVPVAAVKNMGAGITVAVDLNGVNEYQKPMDIFTVVGNAIDIAIDSRTKEQVRLADIKISLDLSKYSLFDNSANKKKLIDEGYKTADQQLSKLVWYRRFNLINSIRKLIKDFIPLKVPEFLKTNKK